MARVGSLDLLWDVPLAVLSWLAFRLARLASRGLILGYTRLQRGRPLEWRLLSAEAIGKPLMLPVIMTSAPRWNPHALIGSLGPLRAERSIGVDASTAARSAGAWTVVIYRFPGSRIVGTVGSGDTPSDDGWSAVAVEPGAYTLALRYYHWSADATVPAVAADGVEVAPALPVPADLNDRLYQALRGRQSRFYRALHHYVYTMLRLRRWLPMAFVERELLPIGNPETRFSYGHVPAGRSLHVRLTESLLAGHDVYLTRYGRDSFPVRWQQIVACVHIGEPLDEDTIYLVRVHGKGSAATTVAPSDVNVLVR